MASWNIGQRTLTRNGDGFLIDGDELIFYHFSGVGPAGVHRWVRDKFAPADPLAAELEFRYEQLIAQCGQATLHKIPPYFDQYQDGQKIPAEHRAIYRNSPDLAKRYPNPYETSASPSFRDEITGGIGPIESQPELVPSAGTYDVVEGLAMRQFDAEHFRKQSGSSANSSAAQLWNDYKNLRGKKFNPNRFFDTSYYLRFVSDDVLARCPTPLHQFVGERVLARVAPSWIFDETYYLESYPDIKEVVRLGPFVCGFEHFVRHGVEEGRDGCSFFNERAYLARHADVAASVNLGEFRTGEAHYVAYGHKEGRSLR